MNILGSQDMEKKIVVETGLILPCVKRVACDSFWSRKSTFLPQIAVFMVGDRIKIIFFRFFLEKVYIPHIIIYIAL
jgi:hypothetical protein